MYDFWFSLGAAIMQPTIITTLANPKPTFTFTNKTMKVAKKMDGTVVAVPNLPVGGLLDKTTTERVRDTIATLLMNVPSVPPISIYTAGRYCQMLNIDNFDSILTGNFQTLINAANSSFVKAKNAVPGVVFSAGFPPFLGLCLLDDALSSLIPAPADANPLTDPLKKFVSALRIDPATDEWKVIKLTMADRGPATQVTTFQTAKAALMLGDNNPWLPGCGDLGLFWGGHSEFTLV